MQEEKLENTTESNEAVAVSTPDEPVETKTEPATAEAEEAASQVDDEEGSEEEEMSQEDFAALLEESENRTLTRVEAGQKITGRVVAVSGGSAYVDIGMRSEASLELNPEDPRCQDVVEGQDLDVFVMRPNGQVQLSLDPIMGKGDFTIVESAHEAGTEVEGRVNSVVKGGYEVNVTGVRCFCPHSQIALRGVADPNSMVGQTFNFKIIELERRSKNVVLSRRAILDAERKEKLAAIRERLEIGAVLPGVVRDIQSFGAFVDLGGIQGLLHISQLSYSNVGRVEDVVSIGEKLDVKILDITTDKRGKERISLSIKALLPNPWENLPFEEGQTIQARVARKSNFGIFMNLAPSIDGLLPRRLMRRAGEEVSMDDFEVGDEVEVEVLEINRDERKIALALPGHDDVVTSDLREGDSLKVEVIKALPVGLLVRGIDDPARGLIHKRHLRGGSMKQIVDAYPVGAQMDVVLSEIDEQGRYNFVLPGAGDEVDASTVRSFESAEDLGHNPFATFFNDN